MENQSNSQNTLNAILEIIRGIAEKSDSDNYIYRGEPDIYDRVSSSLWRECERKMQTENFDIQAIEGLILDSAKNYTPEQEEIEIWAELQHYGGHTNLIDFTTDSHIALFFACDRFFDKPGRIIFLGEEAQDENQVEKKTQNPRNRIIAQKSVFIRPPTGVVEPDDVIIIPVHLKQPILGYLDKHHGISTETIYNDLHGFIRNQDIHQSACIEFYVGSMQQQTGDPENEHTSEVWTLWSGNWTL